MAARFYTPQLPDDGSAVRLPDEEAHHLAHVLRLGVGHSVQVFDGQGREHRAEIVEVSRRGVVVQPRERVEPARESPLRVVLAQAVLKGEHMDAVVRDATMLGVAAIRPVVTDHVVVPARALANPGLVARWWRVALGSSKQCGRAVVPAIAAPSPFREVLGPGATTVMLVEPRCTLTRTAGLREVLERDRPLVLLVGPEGGWSDAELASAERAGVLGWSLGPRTLRAESAPIVALSILDYLTGAAAGLPNAG